MTSVAPCPALRLRQLLVGVPAGPAVVGLASRGPADLVDQPDRSRHLVTRDQPAQVRLEHSHVDVVALPRLDQGRDSLPEALVGKSDHQGIEDVLVRLQRALDLLRVDLLAAGVDARVAATQERERAVGLNPGEVAWHRVPGTVHLREQGRGLDRVLEVTERDVAAARESADPAGANRSVELVDHDR